MKNVSVARPLIPITTALLLLTACNGRGGGGTDTGPLPELDTHSFAQGCYVVQSAGTYLSRSGDGYAFVSDAGAATPFRMQPADLGTYLLYDDAQGYLFSEGGSVTRATTLESDVSRMEDGYISGAEWALETSRADHDAYQLRNLRNDKLFAGGKLVGKGIDAAPVTFTAAEGCAIFPELSLDAEGAITTTTFPDGTLYGAADIHSHLMSDLSFGGGLFHGGAFHRLGVEHALGDCDVVHGQAGRRDFFGYAYDNSNEQIEFTPLIGEILAGELSEDNHATDGYPTFSDWPDATRRYTHQAQYYRWVERAYLGGMRLLVQHATSNAVLCHLSVGQGIQPSRYDCEDMTAVDRIIEETYALERYVDARSGGPGEGWFRVVTSPAEARAVIEDGKLAVVLGIEVSDLFDCHLTQREGFPTCDEAHMIAQLDAYYERGVRALFPVHKYDNQFSAGDGSRSLIEMGNFVNSGHWTNMTEDCPATSTDPDMPPGYDAGPISFGGLLEPRDDYDGPPPNDMSAFPEEPLSTLLTHTGALLEGGLKGDWCQAAGLTPLGERLIEEMMARGMLLEIAHFPQRSYKRVYELLEASDYPAVGSHGRHWDGRLQALGGIANIRPLERCRDEEPGKLSEDIRAMSDMLTAQGAYPAVPLGFDLNGLAAAPLPRFGERSGCTVPQDDPVTYPFTAYAGDVTFTPPAVGEREVDFNTDGFIHIGMFPEMVEDARKDAISEADLEPLFRAAEGYIRTWERAEARAAELR